MNKTPISEQPSHKLQKAYNVRLVVCIIIYTFSGIPTIFGIISCIDTPLLGLAVLIPTTLVILATALLHVTSIKKYRPLVLSALSREIHASYEIDEHVTELFLTDGIKLSFTEDGALLNGNAVNLEAAYATAALKISSKMYHDEIFPVIVIKTTRSELEFPITRALIARLSERNIEIINACEIDAFYENTEKILDSYLFKAAMSAIPKLVPLAPDVAKSSPMPKKLAYDKDTVNLLNAIPYIIVPIAGVFALISDGILRPIINTIAIVFALFFRPKNTNTVQKLLLLSATLPLWLRALGAVVRNFYLLMLLFALALIAENAITNVITDANAKKNLPNISISGMYGAMSLFSLFMFYINNLHYPNHLAYLGKSALTALIIATLAASVYMILRSNTDSEQKKSVRNAANKHSKVAITIVVGILTVMIGSVTFSTLNMTLDRSEPEEHIGVIIETNRGSKSKPNADVSVNNETIRVTLTQPEYDELKHGDTIKLIRYEGALGSAYYVRVRN